MKLFESGWDHVGAKTWVAKPARTNHVVVPNSSTTAAVRGGELSRRPSIARLETGRQEQPQLVDEQARRLKELRLAELTRQLELTQLQQLSQPASGISRPMSPLSRHSLDNPPPRTSAADIAHQHLVWQRKLQEADDLNARIEALRQAGMPPDQLPSPILLPSRPASRPPTNPPARPTPRDYPHPHDAAFFAPDPAALRHQPSKKSFHSFSNHPSKPSSPVPPLPPPPPAAAAAASSVGSHHHTSQQQEGGPRVGSSVGQQASYYQALKDAEEVISKLRKSHDELLEKVQVLEEQMVLKDAEIGDLNTRNTRLETYLADEQTAKDHLQRENDRAMAQLRVLSRLRDQQPVASNPRPVDHLRGPSNPPAATADIPLNFSNARAELLKREEKLERQYGYSLSERGSGDPAIARPSSRMASPAVTLPPASQGTYPAHHLYQDHPLPRSTPLRPAPLSVDPHLPRSTTAAYPHDYLHQSPAAGFAPSGLPPFSHLYPPY